MSNSNGRETTVRHAIVSSKQKFVFLRRGGRVNRGFQEIYICGTKMTSVFAGDRAGNASWYDKIQNPSGKSRWVDNQDYAPHSGVLLNGLLNLEEISCRECLEHPKLSLLLLQFTNL